MNSGMVTKARDFLHRHWRRALALARKNWSSMKRHSTSCWPGWSASLAVGEPVFLLRGTSDSAGRSGGSRRTIERLGTHLVPTLGGLAAGLILHWACGSSARKVRPTCSKSSSRWTDGCRSARNWLKRFRPSSALPPAPPSGGKAASRNWRRRYRPSSARSRNGRPTGCGCWSAAAGPSGIAAAYTPPIAGAVFASLIVLGNFR